MSRAVVALTLLAAAPAFAKKKPAAEPAPAPEPAAEAAAPVDPKLVPPTPDTFGRVHFGPSSGADLGRVTVKAPSSDNIKVFLEGRFFGNAPITIYSVPKGDYIIEGTYPDGKTVSKPVSVLENEDSNIDLTGAHPADAPGKNQMFASNELSPGRWTATKAFAIAAGVGLVGAIAFGIFKMQREDDYKNAPNDNAKLDSIANAGKRDALLANVGWAIAIVGVGGAAVCAYPMFIKPTAEKKTIAMSRPTFIVVPASTGAAGAMTMRF